MADQKQHSIIWEENDNNVYDANHIRCDPAMGPVYDVMLS